MGGPFLLLILTCLSVHRALPYFLWCCFCRAASDSCPWRISLLCLSISPSIRAKAWEPMKARSAPKPSSSSSGLSVTKSPSIQSFRQHLTVNAANRLWMSQQGWPPAHGVRLTFENGTEVRCRYLKNCNKEGNYPSMCDTSLLGTHEINQGGLGITIGRKTVECNHKQKTEVIILHVGFKMDCSAASNKEDYKKQTFGGHLSRII